MYAGIFRSLEHEAVTAISKVALQSVFPLNGV